MTYPTNQIPSTNPQNLVIATPIGLQSNPRDPNAQDNTFVPGTEWQNTVTKMFFKCSATSFAGATWVPFIPSASGTVSELTGNSGGGVGPTGAGNIFVVGDTTTITIAGNPGTNTLTASLVGGGVASQSYITNVAGPVSPTASGVIDLNASTSTYTDGTVANTIKIELQGTNHALFVGRGVHAPATTLLAATNGQLPIGNTGADPTIATLTAGTGISIANGAGSITISATGALNAFNSINVQTFTNTGTYTPTAGMVFCTVECVGGGGGGGGAATSSPGNGSAGAGGGAGGYARKTFTAVAIGASQTVTIGAAGAAGLAGANNGGNGGTSSLGILLTATGGTGGAGGTSGANISTPGGAGGTGTLGDFNTTGGGGSAGVTLGAISFSGNGAQVFFGGMPAQEIAFSGSPMVTGTAGQSYGAGGNGGSTANAAATAGGAGFAGIIVITEFIT